MSKKGNVTELDSREYNLVATKYEGSGQKKHPVEYTLVTGKRPEVLAKMADYQYMKGLKKGGYTHIGMRATAA